MILQLNNNTNKKSFPTGRTFLFVIRYMVEPTWLDLEGIYDETHKTGGNKMKDKDVEKLYAGFKTDFLPRLSKSQGIVLKPDWFNF